MKSNSKKRKASEKSDDDEDEKTTRSLPLESEGLKLAKTTAAAAAAPNPGEAHKSDSELKSDETTTVVEVASGLSRESPEKPYKTPEKATPTVTQDNKTTTTTSNTTTASDLPTTSSRTHGEEEEEEEQQHTQSMKDVTAEREEATNEGESGKTLEINLTTTTTTKPSKSVRFTNVKIFEFERCQGFSSIPGNFAPFNETITLGKPELRRHRFNYFI